jgi:hypothetical protein
MSGILDSKVRIMDTFITPEGRSQLAKGALKAVYYTFTDSGAIYKTDTIVSGPFPETLDETYRFTLESTGLPQDQITFESDDSGKLVGFPVVDGEKYIVASGQIFSGSSVSARVQITGSQFASLSGDLLSSSLDAFTKQMILRSPDPVDSSERQFLVGPKNIEFSITKAFPFKPEDIKEINVDHAESFFIDKKINHISNFKFLPPVNRKRPGQSAPVSLGNYVNINQAAIENIESLEQELKKYESTVVNFTETSRENNLFCQFFETSEGAMRKLDVVDFGYFINKSEGTTKHVFFVGKIFIDDNNSPTFINMFTLMYE